MVGAIILGIILGVAVIGAAVSEIYEAGYKQGRLDEGREMARYLDDKKKN